MNQFSILILSTFCLFVISGCNEETNNTQEPKQQNTIEETKTEETTSTQTVSQSFDDWTEESHSNEVDPNYAVVFPQDSVNRMDIVISPEDWKIMTENMTELYGEQGELSEQTGAQGEAPNGQTGQRTEGGERPVRPEGEGGGGGNRGGGADLGGDTENPTFVESQVFFNGEQWYNVGLRFKGNSSLRSVWNSGNMKLPFKMDFDEFEDDYPELNNQRFYGFKQLSFSSNYSDTSLLHEKLATEAFEEAGVATPQTAFYQLYIDYGEGPTYFGVYTAVEVIGDSVFDREFGDDSGNLYKAEGTASNLSAQSADSLTVGFVKKSNEDEDDWTDLQALSTIINSETRTTDYDQWKKDLEEVFDTDAFLNWLAVNTTIQNWDTYGAMTHNYYLYNNPDTNQLTWIPWDNNESFAQGKRSSVTPTFNGIGEDWPLIRYLIDDEEYRAKYIEYTNDFVQNTLSTEPFQERVTFLHNLVKPYAVGENGEQTGFTFLRSEEEFNSSLDQLLEYIDGRIELASSLSSESDWEYDPTTVQTNQRGPGAEGGFPPQGDEFPPGEGFPPEDGALPPR